jgi:hypothetical protein
MCAQTGKLQGLQLWVCGWTLGAALFKMRASILGIQVYS